MSIPGANDARLSPAPALRLNGDALRRAREARGLSRELVAGLAGVGLHALTRAESGLNEPRASALARICVVLGVPMGDMFDEVAAAA